MSKQISIRGFLKIAGAAGAAALLSGCLKGDESPSTPNAFDQEFGRAASTQGAITDGRTPFVKMDQQRINWRNEEYNEVVKLVLEYKNGYVDTLPITVDSNVLINFATNDLPSKLDKKGLRNAVQNSYSIFYNTCDFFKHDFGVSASTNKTREQINTEAMEQLKFKNIENLLERIHIFMLIDQLSVGVIQNEISEKDKLTVPQMIESLERVQKIKPNTTNSATVSIPKLGEEQYSDVWYYSIVTPGLNQEYTFGGETYKVSPQEAINLEIIRQLGEIYIDAFRNLDPQKTPHSNETPSYGPNSAPYLYLTDLEMFNDKKEAFLTKMQEIYFQMSPYLDN